MNQKVLIIAEAGVNHNGSLERAKQLILAASEAGADFVKFQTFKADKLVSLKAVKAEYQIKNTSDESDSQFGMLKKLEMPEEMHYELVTYAKQNGIAFLSTGFDEESIDFLTKLGTPMFKIPSGEITNKPFIEHIASKGMPVILSTGMADLNEVKVAVALLEKNGISKEKITVLHCNTEYPTPMEDVNLHAMNEIKREIGVQVGYSDHTLGIEVPIASVALGATIIEKHFTLDKTLPGPDHAASLEPGELKKMVEGIRNIEKAISGSGLKTPSLSEIKNKVIARKSIHLKKDMKIGEVISASDLIMKRPGDGISPMLVEEVIGKKLTENLQADHKLSFVNII
jgi:N,N'-diacetyllegionaminate synthase